MTKFHHGSIVKDSGLSPAQMHTSEISAELSNEELETLTKLLDKILVKI